METKPTFHRFPLICLAILTLVTIPQYGWTQDQLNRIWDGLAPGESSQSTGVALPRRANENPPATRIKDITLATVEVFQPTSEHRTGAAV
ncbi:MAG: hypothetical protein VX936_01610, partial [Planctomycetota bacterium]|nr:hypothetical protein [Planctomycetota bacterium]